MIKKTLLALGVAVVAAGSAYGGDDEFDKFLSGVAEGQASGQVLYCIDEAVAGFVWEGDTTRRVGFVEERRVMKVLSEEERMAGDTHLKCKQGLVGVLACEDRFGDEIWKFKGDQFTRAFLQGGNLGGNPNIAIAYGTCTKF